MASSLNVRHSTYERQASEKANEEERRRSPHIWGGATWPKRKPIQKKSNQCPKHRSKALNRSPPLCVVVVVAAKESVSILCLSLAFWVRVLEWGLPPLPLFNFRLASTSLASFRPRFLWAYCSQHAQRASRSPTQHPQHSTAEDEASPPQPATSKTLLHNPTTTSKPGTA